MPRVVHFEIPADNPESVAKFYTDVFGWEIKKWEGPVEYWLVMTGNPETPGIDGGIMRKENPSQTTINTIDVGSVDEFADKIQSFGGGVVVPKLAIPGVGYMAYCKDPEGNIFGIMQEDRNAK